MRCNSIKAFRQLRTETTRLATNSCSGELVDDLPTYIKDEIPANLPDFFAGSPSSLRLRASYVQYLICRTLNSRIFQPFLFTLDRRQEAANSLFEDWSYRLRKKSVKREATWRQHTLQAAYTARTAKQATNKMAGQLVAELSGEIKYFVSKDRGEAVQSALKRIVKLAVETWRHARYVSRLCCRVKINLNIPGWRRESLAHPCLLTCTHRCWMPENHFWQYLPAGLHRM